MLQLRDVWASYGAALAIRGVSLDVGEGSVVALLGANGSGKTSTLHAIAGLLPVSSGTITYQGKRIDGMRTEALVRAGISLVPEGRMLFGEMTVGENLKLGAYVRRDPAGVRRDMGRLMELFPVLGERREERAALLSGGEQQMLAIARGLMSAPRLLLLDEPSLSVAPMMVRTIFRAIEEVSEEGMAVLLAEQNVSLSLEIAREGCVLETGKIVLAGPAEELRQNETVRRSYLGY